MLESLFFIKSQDWRPAYLLKRVSNTGVFLWTLQNLQDHLFWSTYANKCFCISEIQTTNNVIYTLTENLIFNFRIYKIFSYLLSFANFSSSEFVFAFAFFSHTISNISHNISNDSFSSSLNRSNAFSHCQKFVIIGNAQNLSSGFI